MNKLIQSLPTWLTEPATILGLVLFIVSTVISLYAGEIRHWMRNTGQGFNEREIRRLKNRIALLGELNGNAYELVRWALWGVLQSFVYYTTFVFIVGMIVMWVHLYQGKPAGSIFQGALEPMLGVFLGRALNMYEIINLLNDYPKAIAGLTKEVQRREAKQESAVAK